MAIRKEVVLTGHLVPDKESLRRSLDLRLSVINADGAKELVIDDGVSKLQISVEDLAEALYDLVPERFNVNHWPPGAKDNLREASDRSNKPTVKMPIGGAVLTPAELPDMCKWTRFDPNEVIGPGVAPENQLSTKLPEDLQSASDSKAIELRQD